ncbi:hypothetical protein [Faecalitalea cylindroides]|uniref:hypothetical protein n=1 Tax=Faecalitalea cylindroides TaxID=39483 RepID=UPI0039F62841
MISDLIFLKKEVRKIEYTVLREEILNLFKKLFIDLDEQNSTFFVNNQDGKISYKISGRSKDMLCVKLECNETSMKAAKTVSTAIDVLTKGEHRRKFHIILSYDESSYYCCNQLMPYFGTFERLIRKIVYFTVTKAYGNEWVEKTFEISLKKDIQTRSKENSEKLIDHALDELTYEQLKKYLFEPISELSLESVLENELSIEKLKKLEKNEIINVLDKCRKISLWARFFNENPKLENFESKIDKIQKYRNIVMHNKRISFDDYLMVRKELKKINKQLMEAMIIIENKTFKDVDYLYIMEHLRDSLARVFESISNIDFSGITSILTNFGEMVSKSVQDMQISESISKEN